MQNHAATNNPVRMIRTTFVLVSSIFVVLNIRQNDRACVTLKMWCSLILNGKGFFYRAITSHYQIRLVVTRSMVLQELKIFAILQDYKHKEYFFHSMNRDCVPCTMQDSTPLFKAIDF